ncbi:O-antigen ligase family protein [Brasilonema sp. UFV-L1]|uniref:O-antigen ligase family protein n=1 Tax=Brasilonema sp. UFV-L1 TaxID=2234130 RepID=UPI00145C6CE9|nr:O-antigen ligase family protein [Brasilonema sp. UFV-L1]NMG07239.1 O-antigen ligase family protein [Brasilonema sp. UFV-L1]
MNLAKDTKISVKKSTSVKTSPRFADWVFAILGFLCLSSILFALTRAGLLPQFVFALIKYFVWGMSIILVCIFWKKTIVAVTQNITVCLLVGLCLLSFSWSEFPNYTLSIATEVLIMAFFGLYFAIRFSLKEQVQLLAVTLLIVCFLSVIFALVFPAVGIHGAHEEYPGAWRGVYGQKNAFGSVMVLSSLTFFALPKENSTLYKWFGFSFSLVLILLSTSKTSLVISFLLILVMMFYKNFRWQGKISIIFIDIGILILGCIALFVFSNWIELITGLGRDPTLTGRTPLWGYGLSRLMERPLLGYGFAAFFAPNSHYAVEAGYAVGTNWIAPNAHNGFLDISLDLGLIGLSLFFITYFIAFARALKLAYASEHPENVWPLAYLTYLALNNVTESSLMAQFSTNWMLFVVVVVTLNKKMKSEKLTF